MLKSREIPFRGVVSYYKTAPPRLVSVSRKLNLSHSLQQRAETFFPGGVNSPVRAFRAVGGEPPIIVSGSGARMTDADGNRYIDYVLSWGPLMLGHCAPEVVEAVIEAARKGTSFGASTPSEADLAEQVIQAFPPSKNCASSPVARRPRCRPSAWPAPPPTASTSSSLKAAITATATLCWSRPAPASPPSASPGSAGVPEEFVKFTLALALQQCCRAGRGFCKLQGPDCLRHHRAGRGQHGLRSAQARLPRGGSLPDPARGKSADL